MESMVRPVAAALPQSAGDETGHQSASAARNVSSINAPAPTATQIKHTCEGQPFGLSALLAKTLV
jgi:hypothetical protein